MSPIGVHTLQRPVSELCKTAGVSGFKTNHSLRVTTATRLFQNGLDEQLIMERTGHRSLDRVRGYKRTSQEHAARACFGSPEQPDQNTESRQ